VSISSISSVTSLYQPTITDWQNNLSQVQQGFQDLASALQAGNLADAQNAFTALQQLLPNSSAGNQTQNGQQGSGQNTFAADFQALAQALKSGNLTDAQNAFSKLQGHHHHHHPNNASASTQSTASSSSVGSTAGSGQNQFATDFSAFGQALQSGDLSQAQAAFAQLLQDMGSVGGNFNVSV